MLQPARVGASEVNELPLPEVQNTARLRLNAEYTGFVGRQSLLDDEAARVSFRGWRDG